MERLIRELKAMLLEEFPGAEIDLDYSKLAHKVGGVVSWDGFSGMEPIDRQITLWKVIRAQFNREDQLRISALISLAPAEYAVMREPQPA